MQKPTSIEIFIYAVATVLIIASFLLAENFLAVILAVVAVGIVVWQLKLIPDQKIMTKEQNSKREPVQQESSFKPIKPTFGFEAVAGLDQVLSDLEEIVDYFQNPSKYHKFGIKLPKGVLLAGKPGVGKTLIAKALAKEAGVNFFYASGSSFVHMFVGVGPKKISELFATARKNAPAIVFIDEIDAVGKSRGGFRADERENTLNQLLTEMDGYDSHSQVVVLAATNRIEMLDSALLRAGRFDRKIEIGLPSTKEREAILNLHLKGKKHKIDTAKLANMTVGFSGASLATLVNEAAIQAVKQDKSEIEEGDVLAVKDKIISLKQSGSLIDDSLREKIANYQSAKAYVAKRLGVAFEKATITGDFLSDTKEIFSESDQLNKIASYLSGVVYTKAKNEELLSISKDDISKADELASEFISSFEYLAEKSKNEILQNAYEIAQKSIDISKIESIATILAKDEMVSFDIL